MSHALSVRTQFIITALTATILSAVFICVQVWKYYHFGYNESDLAIIHQVFYSIVNGSPFYSSFLNHNYLGDHVNLVIALILPIYALAQHPLTLLIIQTLSVYGAGIVLYFYARAFAKRIPVQSTIAHHLPLIISLVWLLNPFVHRANLFGFHFLTLVPLFLFTMLFAYEKRRFGWFVITSLLLAGVREELSLIVLLFSIIPFKERREKKWFFAPLGIGFSWFIFSSIVIQAFSPIGLDRFKYYYGWLLSLGSSGGLAGASNSIGNILTLGNLEFLIGLVVPLALLPLFSGRWVVIASPLAVGLLMFVSGVSALFLFMHYTVPLYALLTVGVLDVLTRAINRKSFLGTGWRKDVIPLYPSFLLVALVYTSVLFSPVPQAVATLIGKTSLTNQGDPRNALLSHIPKYAPVLTSDDPMALFSGRDEYYSLWLFLNGKQLHSFVEYEFRVAPQYVLINEEELVAYTIVRRDRNNTKESLSRLRNYLIENNFTVLDKQGTWWLFVKNGSGGRKNETTNWIIPDVSDIPCDDLWLITSASGETQVVPCTAWHPQFDQFASILENTAEQEDQDIKIQAITLSGGLELDPLGTVQFIEDAQEISEEVYEVTLTRAPKSSISNK